MIPLATQLLAIANKGLLARGQGEEAYLAPLFDRLERRQSPAMEAQEEFAKDGLETFIEKHIISL